MTDSQPPLPRLVLEENVTLLRLLRRLRHWVLRYPGATRTLVQSLVAEGRRFAETPEGHRWRENLAGSEVIRRGRLVWGAYGLDKLIDDEPAILPSDWTALFIEALTNTDIEETLSTLMMDEARDETFFTLSP